MREKINILLRPPENPGPETSQLGSLPLDQMFICHVVHLSHIETNSRDFCREYLLKTLLVDYRLSCILKNSYV